MESSRRDNRVRYGFIADDDLGVACQGVAEAALRRDAASAVSAVLRFARKRANMLKPLRPTDD